MNLTNLFLLLLPAFVAGSLVACVAAPLGAFLVWRRQTFLGDALSHGAILGVALSLLLGTGLNLTVIIFCLVFAGVFVFLQRRLQMSHDAVMAILAQLALAAGLVLASVSRQNVDLMIYLFGDILSVNAEHLYAIAGTVVLILSVVIYCWRDFLAVTFDPELAQVEGLPVAKLQFGLTALTALLVALALKVVGALLITALMIIPVTTARLWVKTPEQMVFLGAGLGIVSVWLGLGFSIWWDVPTGPSMVMIAGILFLLSAIIASLAKR